MSSTAYPTPEEVDRPGRLLFRHGFLADVSQAALRLGEGAIITDKWWGCLGDESQNPCFWPTSKSTGTWDSTNLDYSFDNVNTRKINGRLIKDFFSDYLSTVTLPTTGSSATPANILTVITQSVSKTVYSANADFVDLDAAYQWLSQRTIAAGVIVSLVFPAGKITETKSYNFNHPNGDRINWIGGALKAALPNMSGLSVNGASANVQTTDTANNLTTLRNCFATELTFTQGGSIAFSGNIGLLQNILFTSDGAKGSAAIVNGLSFNNCIGFINNIAVVGFDYYGLSITNGGSVLAANNSSNYFMGNGLNGISLGQNSNINPTYGHLYVLSNGAKYGSSYPSGIAASSGSSITAYPIAGSSFVPYVVCSGNGYFGLSLNSSTLDGTMILICNQNANHGVLVGASSSFKNSSASYSNSCSYNGANGMTVDGASYAFVLNFTIGNNSAIGIGAYNGSFVNRNGTTTPNNGQAGVSPQVGSIGNSNAYMV